MRISDWSSDVCSSDLIDQAGDAVPADAAGHDAVEMRQLRLDVQGDAVEGHPAPDPHADGGALVLAPGLVAVGAAHPDPDPAVATLAGDAEPVEGSDPPFHPHQTKPPHVRLAPCSVGQRNGPPL